MGTPDTPVKFWFEHDGWFHIPKGFLLTSEGTTLLPWLEVVQDNRSIGRDLPPLHVTATFGAPPHPSGQPRFIEEMVANIQANGHGGIATSPTRSGKTYCAIEAACRLGRTTLILVDRGVLQDQWRMAIEGDPNEPNAPRVVDAHGMGVRCGIIRENEFDIRHPFTIAMVQTLAKRALNDEVRKAFGLVILDECSSAVSATMMSALQRVDARFVLGLSATPHDAGSLSQAVDWVLGPPIASLHRKLDAEVRYLHIPYSMTTTVLCTNKHSGKQYRTRLGLTRNGDTDIVSAEKMLMSDEGRVQILAAHITQAWKDGRRVLVVVGLREHAAVLAAAIAARSGYQPGILIAGKGEGPRKTMEREIVVATRQLISKGTDFKPPATAMFIVCPISKVQQLAGRVLQPQCPVLPLIVDVVDGARQLIELAVDRDRFYKSREFLMPNPVWPAGQPMVSEAFMHPALAEKLGLEGETIEKCSSCNFPGTAAKCFECGAALCDYHKQRGMLRDASGRSWCDACAKRSSES